MNKIFIGIALLGIAVLTLGTAGFVYAQTQTPPEPSYPYGHGMGMMRGGFGWMGNPDQEGPMHEAMVAVLAEALDLEPGVIEERHEAGESIWDIAAEEGMSDEEIRTLMESVHDSALEEAIAGGQLTPEQAEWMEEHMQWMGSGEGEYNGYGGHCGGMSY